MICCGDALCRNFTKYCNMHMQNFQFGTTVCYRKTNIMFSFYYCVNIMDSYLRWHCSLLALNKSHAAKFLKCFCSSNVIVCFQMSDVFALLFKSSVCLCWILKESIFSQTIFAQLRIWTWNLGRFLAIGHRNMLCLVMLLREMTLIEFDFNDYWMWLMVSYQIQSIQ